MRPYRYKALSPVGTTIRGYQQSSDVLALEQELAARNLILLDASSALGMLDRFFTRQQRIRQTDLRDFTLHMATCLGAGIPLIQALHDFEETSSVGPFRRIIKELREEIAAGGQVTEAMGRHGNAFSDLYIAMISAGESSGNLDHCFRELVEHLEWQGTLRGQIKQALFYPAMLGTAVAGLFVFMVAFIIPRFMAVFKDLNFELPAITRNVLAFSDALALWWPWLVGGIIMFITCLKLVRRTIVGRYYGDLFLLSLPVLGDFRLKLALSRFSRNFSALLGAGIDILRVLEMLERVVDNSVLEREIRKARLSVVTGKSLAESFETLHRFPPLLRRLISVGEMSGQLENTMGKASEYLDKDLPRVLKRIFTIMEALVIVLLGALIAIAALSMLLPIFSIQGQFGK